MAETRQQLSAVYGRQPRPPTKPNDSRHRGPRTAKTAGGAPPAVAMVVAIHAAADENGDGFLDHREFGRIQKLLGHEAPNRQSWKQICAVLGCDARTGISGDALARLYEMSGAAPDADYNALFGEKGGAFDSERADYDPVAAARAEHAANQRRPKQPKTEPRHARTARGARSIKSTYGNKAPVGITTDADLYRTAENMSFAVHKRSVEQGNMLKVLQDAAVASEQSGHAEKAKLIEQACAYVKQEADAVKQAAFTAAFEKLQAKAIEKQKAEAQRIAKLENERQERLKREMERVRARERQKTLLQEEKEAKKAEKQSAARALKKNGLLLEVQQKAKEDEARSARLVARSQLNRGRSRLLKKNDVERQEMLEERRRQRALEKAQVEKEREKERERLKAAQERNQIDLLERALEKAKLEALRRAEIEAMREAKQAIARMRKHGRFDTAVEEHVTKDSDRQTNPGQTNPVDVQVPEISALAPPNLALINRVAVSTSDFPALEPLDATHGRNSGSASPEIVSEEIEPEASQDVVPADVTEDVSTETAEGVQPGQAPEADLEVELPAQDAVPADVPEEVITEAPEEAPLRVVTQSRPGEEAESQVELPTQIVPRTTMDLAEHQAQKVSTPATPSSGSQRGPTSDGLDSQHGRLNTPWKRTHKRSNPWQKQRARYLASDVLAAARVELDATSSAAAVAAATGTAKAGQTTGGFGMRRSSKMTPHERRMHQAEQVAAMAKAQTQRVVTQAS